MDKKDFKVGQTVYLLLRNNAARGRSGEDLIREAKVTAIGEKYIVVSPGYYTDYARFNIEESFREETDYCVDYKLFLTRQDVLNYIETDELITQIRKKATKANLVRIPLESLREINKLMDQRD